MIKQLVELVMPKQLNWIGAAIAIGSAVYGAVDANKRAGEQDEANAALSVAEKAARNEQAVRERRKQVRTAHTLGAQATAIQLASGSGVSSDTNVAGAQADISANLDSNLAAMNASIGAANSISTARTNVLNAGRPSNFSVLNQSLQPALFSNIDNINSLFSSTPAVTPTSTT